jgi:hypothetical protein
MDRYFEGNPFESQPEHGHSYRDVTMEVSLQMNMDIVVDVREMTSNVH